MILMMMLMIVMMMMLMIVMIVPREQCLLGLLDKLEVEKQQLASLIQSSDGYAHVEAFSLQIFNQVRVKRALS